MLVMTLRTVTCVATCSWCSRRTISSARRRPARPGARPARRSAGVDRRVLLAQALDELDREGRGERPVVERRQDRGCATRRGFPARPSSRSASASASSRAARRRPRCRSASRAQVLDEDEAQRDRDRPQLADRERRDALVGADEAAERLRVEAAVGVRDEGPGDAVDARIARERPSTRAWAARGRSRAGRSSRISRSCSSTMWKLSTSHSAAGEMTLSRRTRPRSRGRRRAGPVRSPRGGAAAACPRRLRRDKRLFGRRAPRRTARDAPSRTARRGSAAGGPVRPDSERRHRHGDGWRRREGEKTGDTATFFFSRLRTRGAEAAASAPNRAERN